jgi:hypothetical protein
MAMKLEDITPSYFSTGGGVVTPGEDEFYEGLRAVGGSAEARTKLESGAGTRVQEARMYGIAPRSRRHGGQVEDRD